MTISELLNDKSQKAKQKVVALSGLLLNGSLQTSELIAFAEQAKDPEKATCIEALEFATKQNANIGDKHVFDFVTRMLNEKAPRVKWESAKVVANIAHLFPNSLASAIRNLLANCENKGTVVRWASAFALGEILKLKTKHNEDLLPTMEVLCNNEEESGVKKKYLDALKKAKK